MKTNISAALSSYLNNIAVAGIGAPLLIADLYSFTLSDNITVIRMTSWPDSITIGGRTFNALGPYIERTKIKQSIGFSVDEIEVSIAADPSHQITAQPYLQAIAQGLLDGADCLVERLFMPAPLDVSLGTLILFKGQVAEITEVGRVRAKFSVRSRTELLNNPLPRNLYTPACRHVLYDNGCTLNREAYRVSGTVTSGSTKKVINTTLTQPGPVPAPTAAPVLAVETPPKHSGVNLPAVWYFVKVTYTSASGETNASPESQIATGLNQLINVQSPPGGSGITGWNVYAGNGPGQEQRQNGPQIPIGTVWHLPYGGLSQGAPPPRLPTDGYFTLGTITFVSGPNANVLRKVEAYDVGGVVTVMPQLPQTPVAGDVFTIVPGCSRSADVCLHKFNNLIHFGGTPYAPTPESSI
jgi:hypothetical protein